MGSYGRLWWLSTTARAMLELRQQGITTDDYIIHQNISEYNSNKTKGSKLIESLVPVVIWNVLAEEEYQSYAWALAQSSANIWLTMRAEKRLIRGSQMPIGRTVLINRFDISPK